MTTCIVAHFPWAAIRAFVRSEPPGVIVCTDTRVTSDSQGVVAGIWVKQGRLANNIFVCYSSSNLAATTLALNRATNSRSVARIGHSLKTAHQQYGGITELITIVWRANRPPQVLELMPPHYAPVPRRGVIGIGHRGVLESFRAGFFEEPRPDIASPLPTEVLQRLAIQIGRPVGPPRYRIHHAAVNVAGALVEAIQYHQPATVGIPIQLSTISLGRLQSYAVASSPDSLTWQQVSAKPQDARIPNFRPVRIPSDITPRSAVQLFD